MSSPTLKKLAPIELRALGLDEKWLQDRIFEDTSILGLGELEIAAREHRQPIGGRIDFLTALQHIDDAHDLVIAAVDRLALAEHRMVGVHPHFGLLVRINSLQLGHDFGELPLRHDSAVRRRIVVHAIAPPFSRSISRIDSTEILQMNPKPASMFAFSRPSCKTDARC